MPKITPVLRRARKAIQDIDLFKILQSEINHEVSLNRFEEDRGGSLGDFKLDWDSPQSQDVVLRKKCETGEEIAVSALLGSETSLGDCIFPREALMKVCIKKPGLSSILQVDCVASYNGSDESNFDIHNSYLIYPSSCLEPSVYGGPSFSSLDPNLQYELKQYLVARGIEESFTKFLLFHLHKKEQEQYMNWLHKLKDAVISQEE